MNATQHHRESEDHFDLLPYIAILMCVMACLLLVTMGLASTSLGSGLERVPADTTELIALAQQRLNQLQTRIPTLEEALTKSSLTTKAKELQDRIRCCQELKKTLQQEKGRADLDQTTRQGLVKEIASAQAEITEFRKTVGHLQEDFKCFTNAPPDLFGGGYRGPYLLLECVGEEAQVYPDGRRISAKAAEAELDWLRRRIKALGAVALVVRPSAFEVTFPKFQNLTDQLASEARKLIVSYLPLEADQPLQPYLPKGKQL